MTKQDMIDFAGTLTLLSEERGKTVPASSVYLALGSDMGRYNRLVIALRASGAASVTNETLSITAKGQEIAEKIEAMKAA